MQHMSNQPETAAETRRNAAFDLALELVQTHPGEPVDVTLGRIRTLGQDALTLRLVTAEFLIMQLGDADICESFVQDIHDQHPALLRGVDVGDFGAWESADRPGESDNFGYDWSEFAAAVSDRWESLALALSEPGAVIELAS